jgi:hypothetical protein
MFRSYQFTGICLEYLCLTCRGGVSHDTTTPNFDLHESWWNLQWCILLVPTNTYPSQAVSSEQWAGQWAVIINRSRKLAYLTTLVAMAKRSFTTTINTHRLIFGALLCFLRKFRHVEDG